MSGQSVILTTLLPGKPLRGSLPIPSVKILLVLVVITYIHVQSACVSVRVLCRFQQSFSHITTVSG